MGRVAAILLVVSPIAALQVVARAVLMTSVRFIGSRTRSTTGVTAQERSMESAHEADVVGRMSHSSVGNVHQETAVNAGKPEHAASASGTCPIPTSETCAGHPNGLG